MAWFCGEYSVASFIPNSDKNNHENVIPDAIYGSWESDNNFNNNADILNESYSVYDQFKNKLRVDLITQWPVVRLPLTIQLQRVAFRLQEE